MTTQEPTAYAAIENSDRRSRPRILVVDDDVELAAMVSGILESEDYEVLTAFDGFKATDILDRESVDLLITDIVMPRLSGLDLLRHVRARGMTLEVILMSAHTTVQILKEAVEGQAFDYLEEPFTIVDLRTSVRRALYPSSREAWTLRDGGLVSQHLARWLGTSERYEQQE